MLLILKKSYNYSYHNCWKSNTYRKSNKEKKQSIDTKNKARKGVNCTSSNTWEMINLMQLSAWCRSCTVARIPPGPWPGLPTEAAFNVASHTSEWAHNCSSTTWFSPRMDSKLASCTIITAMPSSHSFVSKASQTIHSRPTRRRNRCQTQLW